MAAHVSGAGGCLVLGCGCWTWSGMTSRSALWIPAYAGMTGMYAGNDGRRPAPLDCGSSPQ